MADQDPCRQFQEIQSVVAQYGETFASIKSPQAVYEEEKARLRLQIREAVGRLRTAQSDDETAAHEDAIIELSGQMKDLEHHYKANCEDYAKQHETQLKDIMNKLRGQLGELLGMISPPEFQTTNNQEAPDQAVQEAAEKPAEVASHTPQDSRSGPAGDKSVRRASPDTEIARVTTIPEGAIDQGPIFDDEEDDPIDNDENNDDAGNGGESADIDMDGAKPVEAARRSRRREAVETDTVKTAPIGRTLRNAPLPPASTSAGNTTVGANAAHGLRSTGPSNASPRDIPPSTAKETSKKRKAETPVSTTSKRHRSEIESSKKADADHTESLRNSSDYPTRQSVAGTSRKSTRELSTKRSTSATDSTAQAPPRRSHRHNDESADGDNFEGVLHPKPGSVYVTYWKKTKEWLAVILLPMGDFSAVGIPGSIVSCQLVESLPSCYNKTPKRGRYIWARGYRNGEPLEKERMFPVMYFDGRPFPSKSAIMWIGARDLRAFDIKHQHALVPHIRTVREYLKSRGWSEEDDDTEEEEFRDESEMQEHQMSESPQQSNTEEPHNTQAPEEDPDIPDDITDEEEPSDMEFQSPKEHADRDDTEEQSPSETQTPEPRIKSRSEEPAQQVDDFPPLTRIQIEPQTQEQPQLTPKTSDQPQSQVQYSASRDFSSLFKTALSSEPRRLPSVPAKLPSNHQQNPHPAFLSAPLSAPPPEIYTQRPQSPTVSTQNEPLNSPPPLEDLLSPLGELPSEEVERKPWVKGDTIVILDSDSEDEDKNQAQEKAASEMDRSAPSDPPNAANRSHDRYADQRDDNGFNDRTFQPRIPVQILNPDNSASSPAAAEFGCNARHENESTHERSNVHVQKHFGPQSTSFRAPSSQNSHLPISDTTVPTSAQGQSTSFARAQELLPQPYQSSYRQDNNWTPPNTQSQSSQQNFSNPPNPSQYISHSPKRQVASSLPSQASSQVDNGHVRYPHTQDPMPRQENNNESLNPSTRSSHNPFHLQSTSGITASQAYWSLPRDANGANTTHRPATSDTVNRVPVELMLPSQPPQGPATQPAENHASYAVPQQFSHAQQMPTLPGPVAPTTHHPTHTPLPQERSGNSAPSYSLANPTGHRDNSIDQYTRTGHEAVQGQIQPLSTHTADHTQGMYTSIAVNSPDEPDGQDKDFLQPRLPIAAQDPHDEEIYAQMAHLHPSHACFNHTMLNPVEARVYNQTHSSYFPHSLRRYLQDLLSANGLAPILDSFELPNGDGYWCPFCDACRKHGGYTSSLYRLDSYKRFRNFQQHLIKHWQKAAAPIIEAIERRGQ